MISDDVESVKIIVTLKDGREYGVGVRFWVKDELEASTQEYREKGFKYLCDAATYYMADPLSYKPLKAYDNQG